MRLTYLHPIAIIGIVFHFGSVTGQAQYQRMGIAAGTTTRIAKSSQQTITSYCLDFGVPYALEQSFTYVISPGSAVVKFADTPPMSLEKAIARQPGNKPGLLRVVASDTDAELIIINNRNVECTVEFRKNTGLATKKSEIPSGVTDMQSLLIQNSRQDTRQNNTWLTNSPRYRNHLQSLLAGLGYYKGEINETLNNTQQAIKAFQKVNQLNESDGFFNDQTYDALLGKCKLVYNKLGQLGYFSIAEKEAINKANFRLTSTFKEIRGAGGYEENVYYGIEHLLNAYTESRRVNTPLHLPEFEGLIELEIKLNQIMDIDVLNSSVYTTVGITVTSTANKAVIILGVKLDKVSVFGNKSTIVRLLLPVLTEPALANIAKAPSIPDRYKISVSDQISMQLESPRDFQKLYDSGNNLPPDEPPFKIGDDFPRNAEGRPISKTETCQLDGSICIDKSGEMEISGGCENGLGLSISSAGAVKISASGKQGEVSINLK